MTHCRIARIRLKSGGSIELLKKPDASTHAEMLHHVATLADESRAVAAGVFFVMPNGAVYVDHTHDAGTSALHTIGGAALLLTDIQDYENKSK